MHVWETYFWISFQSQTEFFFFLLNIKYLMLITLYMANLSLHALYAHQHSVQHSAQHSIQHSVWHSVWHSVQHSVLHSDQHSVPHCPIQCPTQCPSVSTVTNTHNVQCTFSRISRYFRCLNIRIRAFLPFKDTNNKKTRSDQHKAELKEQKTKKQKDHSCNLHVRAL